MPRYAALILTERGARRRHTLEARTLEEARATLRATGVFIERISQTDRSWQLRRIKIARKHQIHLFRQMETLLSAGILIPDAVGKLKDRFPDRRTRQVLQEDVYKRQAYAGPRNRPLEWNGILASLADLSLIHI